MPALSLPDVRQEGYSDCGPAAVYCVLEFLHRKPRSLHEVTAALHTNDTDGTDPRTIEGYLRGLGCRVQSGEMAVSDLRWHTQQGRPVIVVVRGHYVVAAGVAYNRVVVQDPLNGLRRISVPLFLGSWREVDRLGAVYRQFGIAVEA